MNHPLRHAVLAVTLAAQICRAGNYHVSSTDPQASDDGGGTQGQPWKTLSPVGRHNNIYFSADGTQADPCGLPLGEGEKIADPGFVDYAKADYHLRRDSPAIDAGFNSNSATDFDGKKVPLGKARDIGAFEFGDK